MHRRTKALSITPKVKQSVWERDGHQCILCHSPYAFPDAHVLPRSKGGKGIEENIVTLCRKCHDRMDNSTDRAVCLARAREYLEMFYPGFTDEQRIYKK